MQYSINKRCNGIVVKIVSIAGHSLSRPSESLFPEQSRCPRGERFQISATTRISLQPSTLPYPATHHVCTLTRIRSDGGGGRVSGCTIGDGESGQPARLGAYPYPIPPNPRSVCCHRLIRAVAESWVYMSDPDKEGPIHPKDVGKPTEEGLRRL